MTTHYQAAAAVAANRARDLAAQAAKHYRRVQELAWQAAESVMITPAQSDNAAMHCEDAAMETATAAQYADAAASIADTIVRDLRAALQDAEQSAAIASQHAQAAKLMSDTAARLATAAQPADGNRRQVAYSGLMRELDTPGTAAAAQYAAA